MAAECGFAARFFGSLCTLFPAKIHAQNDTEICGFCHNLPKDVFINFSKSIYNSPKI